MSETSYVGQFAEFQTALLDYTFKAKAVELRFALGTLTEAHREEARLAEVKVMALFNVQLTKNQVREEKI